jgi:hypothetical protein
MLASSGAPAEGAPMGLVKLHGDWFKASGTMRLCMLMIRRCR